MASHVVVKVINLVENEWGKLPALELEVEAPAGASCRQLGQPHTSQGDPGNRSSKEGLDPLSMHSRVFVEKEENT